MLTEFGGIAFAEDQSKTWGYSRCETVEDLESHYRELLLAVNNIPIFAGFCYTQLTDTYQEANGLLYMDRTPKVNVRAIASATTGKGEASIER
jgi:hypothetical protein